MSVPPGVFLALREPEDARFYPSVIPVQSYAPPTSAKVWLDTSTVPPVLKGWDGAAWVGFASFGADLDDVLVSSLVADGASSTRGSLESWAGSFVDTRGDARWQRDLGIINVKNHGATGDGTTSDLTAFQNAAIAARAARAKLFIPRGTYYLPGTVDISGLIVEGEHTGYLGQAGTIIKGNGSGVCFNQAQTNTDNIRMSIRGLRFINCATAIKMTYTVHSHLADIAVIDATSTGIILGDNAVIGPLWNQFDRVRVSVTGSSPALLLAGDQWCNNNMFIDCDFKGGTGPAARIQSSGGFGALNNIFSGTEFRGGGVGCEVLGTTRATRLEACYFESDGPSVWLGAAVTSHFSIVGGIFANVKNTNSTGKPNFIHHTGAGIATITVDGGWATTPTGTEYNNLRFVGSDSASTLRLYMPTVPITSAVSGTGFQLLSSTSMAVRSGLVKELWTNGLTSATTLGSVAKRIAVYDETGVLVGYVPVYNTIT